MRYAGSRWTSEIDPVGLLMPMHTPTTVGLFRARTASRGRRLLPAGRSCGKPALGAARRGLLATDDADRADESINASSEDHVTRVIRSILRSQPVDQEVKVRERGCPLIQHVVQAIA